MATSDVGRSRFGVAPEEVGALVVSFASFMLLLASYYILRPVRDALAATLGADSIKYLSSAVFFVMLLIVPVFGWLVARLMKSPADDMTSLMFGLGMNNNGTGLVLASMALEDHPRVLLPIIFYNLVQHLGAGLADRFLSRLPTSGPADPQPLQTHASH